MSNNMLTPEDKERFGGQACIILEALTANYLGFGDTCAPVHRRELERKSGSRRVASRIHDLREYFEIDSWRDDRTKESVYQFKQVRETPRITRGHCRTCSCNNRQGRLNI